MNYKTPGVYVEEIAKFPPSVAQVETAIPAFIGYTYRGPKNQPTRISSMLEYETIFGTAKNEEFSLAVNAATATTPRSVTATLTPSAFKMYYAMQMYFANGGGPCYIVSVGDLSTGFPAAADFDDMVAALDTLEKEDEPTLIVMPDAAKLSAAYDLFEKALDQAELMKDRFVIMDVLGESATAVKDFRDNVTSGPSGERLKYGAAYYPKLETVLTYSYDPKISLAGNTLEHWKTNDTELYNLAKNAMESHKVVLAPSSAMAGVYAKVDSTSGVFKAPLVWGARTLDGNSNEWRYISVRRFFNMVEESVKNATERFVFEANTANTWIRVQTMIENFLNQQWQDGALAGSKPEEAYYVSVGLNKTMSAQDILEGRMNIEIGMAAVRPAEFIVLRFSHKLQEA